MEIVTTSVDSGFGSLRQAIINLTPGGGTITFDPLITVVNITSGELVIGANITIIGHGSGSPVISGNNTSRIFNISAGFTVNISDLTITNGTSINGGGIRNSGILMLDDVIVTGNSASDGGGIYNDSNGNMTISDSNISNNAYTNTGDRAGAGIYNLGTMNIQNSVIDSNGSLANPGFGGGGGVYNTSNANLTINNTIINNNYGTRGGGILNELSSTIMITNTTISNNNATSLTGGGINNNASTITMVNSTISNNIANTSGGGVRSGGTGATMFLTNVTISYNTASTNAGGIFNVSPSVINIGNTIVASNIAPVDTDVRGAFVSAGNNLIGVVGTATGFGGTDIINTAANLGPLANNGGPTPTIMPNLGSPAIDNGNNALIVGYDTDQRGYVRIINGIVDIGAVEFGSVPICFSGESTILVRHKLTNQISEVAAKNIIASLYDVFSVAKNDFVPIRLNFVVGPTTRYMKIEKDLLEMGKPNADFYVTTGHKIVVDGIETKAKNIPHAKIVKTKPSYVYSICIDERGPILVNNLHVIAWGYNEWIKYSVDKKLSWWDNKQ